MTTMVELAHLTIPGPNDKISYGGDRQMRSDSSGSNFNNNVEVNLRSLDKVEARPITWEWKGRIPRGKITLLVGDPGCGKSYLSLAIAKAATWGLRLPGDEQRDDYPGDVLMANFEDGASDTIKPRAVQLKVWDHNLHLIDCTRNNTEIPFSLEHLSHLETAMDRLRYPKIVIIDPIANLLGSIDTAKDNKVRDAIYPLAEFAERRNVAVLAVMHLNKTETMKGIYRVGGSIGFVGLARSVLLVGIDEQSGRRSVVPIKHNLTMPVSPVEFQIDDQGFKWLGESSELTADRLLGVPQPKKAKFAEARQFLIDTLKDGRISKNDLFEVAKLAGHSERTLERAADDLGIKKSKEPGIPNGRSFWELSDVYTAPIAQSTGVLPGSGSLS